MIKIIDFSTQALGKLDRSFYDTYGEKDPAYLIKTVDLVNNWIKATAVMALIIPAAIFVVVRKISLRRYPYGLLCLYGIAYVAFLALNLTREKRVFSLMMSNSTDVDFTLIVDAIERGSISFNHLISWGESIAESQRKPTQFIFKELTDRNAKTLYQVLYNAFSDSPLFTEFSHQLGALLRK